MVKVGFMVEGDTEKILITKSDDFKKFCDRIDIEVLGTVMPNHKGQRGKDLFKNTEKIDSYLKVLFEQGADFIVCLRDQEDLPCITAAKDEIKNNHERLIKVIAVRQIEAWFLSDYQALENFFEITSIQNEFPEIKFPQELLKPADVLAEISLRTRNRGIGDKLLFAKRFIQNYGFSMVRAAQNPECQSTKYFLDKLTQISLSKS
ncbi:MAG: DUF4276 family protein [Runella sp.]